MARIRFLVAFLSVTAVIPSLMAQDIVVTPEDLATESKDLKALKKGKWIVVSVERDGETIPAQFGQKPGDIITFKTENGLIAFG